MGALLSYSILSGLIMLCMYLAYRLCMADDKQYSFNRCVLMLIYLVSFVIIPLALHFVSSPASVIPTSIDIESLNIAVIDTVHHSKPVWGTVLIWIFIAGMATVTIKTIITWIRLTNVIRSGEKFERDGYILVVTDNERYAPFSWMRYVVVSRTDYNNDCSAIEAHELKHIASLHWIDLLIAQLVCIFNWFNPAAWMMRDELMLIHEYQADMAVISNGHDPQAYQMLLIKKAVGSRFPSLANSLNHSKLKKRITMMYKEKSSAGRKFHALALVPMLALAIGLTSVPSVNAAMSAISTSSVSIDKGSESSSQSKIGSKNFKVKRFSNNGNETSIIIEGRDLGNDLTVSGGTFTTMGKTYQAKAMNCNLTDGSATITITFPFTSKYDNSSMTLNVNGEEITLDLEKFFNNTKSIVVADNDTSSYLNSVSKKVKANQGTLKIYYDDKEITEAEMKKIPSTDIAKINVYKDNTTVQIFSKSYKPGGNSGVIKYFLDGKPISETEMNNLSPEKIASINVYKETNTVYITTKK